MEIPLCSEKLEDNASNGLGVRSYNACRQDGTVDEIKFFIIQFSSNK